MQHIAVLAAASASAAGGEAEDVAAWGELFVSMKDFFYVSLCDEELCSGAVEIFDCFLTFLPTDVVIRVRPKTRTPLHTHHYRFQSVAA